MKNIGFLQDNRTIASGGYPWTIISLANIKKYMEALEKASVEQDISAFVEFLAKLIREGLEGKSVQNIPDE